MNWEAIGASGEIVGAAGVIVTLGYLAVQIRQNSRSTNVSTLFQAMQEFNRVTELFATRSDLARIFRLGAMDSPELQPDERYQFVFMLNTYLIGWQTIFKVQERGVTGFADQLAQSIRGLMATPGGSRYFEIASEKGIYYAPFVHEVNRILASGGGDGFTEVLRIFLQRDEAGSRLGI